MKSVATLSGVQLASCMLRFLISMNEDTLAHIPICPDLWNQTVEPCDIIRAPPPIA
jgi:hypothetical protein